jgi:photosystem II stability/assembly factor-like uncharacterized protein
MLAIVLAAGVLWTRAVLAGVNEWTSIGPPGQSDVRLIAIDPEAPATLYAVTAGGVFKTSNGGGSWGRLQVTVAPGEGRVSDPDQLVLDSSGTLYARTTVCEVADPSCATPQPDVLRTADGGASWARLHLPIGAADRGIAAIGARDQSVLYVATGDAVGTLIKTSDGGATWQRTEPILSHPFFPDAAAILGLVVPSQLSDTLYARTTYAGLVKTTDGGATWSHVGAFGPVLALTIAPSTPSTLFAVAGSAGNTRFDPCASGRGAAAVYRTTDAATWTVASRGLEHVLPNGLAIDPRSSDVVWTSATCDVFSTRSGGARWVPTGLGRGASAVAVAVGAAMRSTVYAVADGIMRLDVVECRTTSDCADGNRHTVDVCAPSDTAADFRGCTNRCVSDQGCARWDTRPAGVSPDRRTLHICAPANPRVDTHGCRYAAGDEFGAFDLLEDLRYATLTTPPCDTGLMDSRLAGFVRDRVAGAQDALYRANLVSRPLPLLRRAGAGVGHMLDRLQVAGRTQLDDACRSELVPVLKGVRRAIRQAVRGVRAKR